MYYNTTASVQPVVGKYRERAKSQDVRILAAFLENPRSLATPSQVLSWVFNGSVPLTSVRRSLTDLTNAGELVKTDKQVEGPYGRPEYQWKLAPKYDQREMF